MAFTFKLLRFFSRRLAGFREFIEQKVYTILKRLAGEHRNGPLKSYSERNDARISAFYKDYAEYESIADWGIDMPNTDPQQAALILDHGYDEEKVQLELADLQHAAAYRGGECLSLDWNGGLYISGQRGFAPGCRVPGK